MSKQKKVDGESLIPKVVNSVLGASSFKQATKELSQMDSDKLSRALGMTVEDFRTKFADQLRAGAAEMLELLRARRYELKPGELAFALSVLTDKANALESRSTTLSNSVIQQVNNFYGTDKQAILDLLAGKKPPTLPTHPNSPPTPSQPQQNPKETVIDLETIEAAAEQPQ
jgi:plasmid maintenance system antidote protein VapI